MSAIVKNPNTNNFNTMRASLCVDAASCTGSREFRIKNSKYNTLTLAEAKSLNRHLNGRRPIRTASVLNKPRAPQARTPTRSINQTLALEHRNLQDSNRTLNESFYSAKSDCKCKSASKVSLSSSTSKVFKDQFSNIKRFFRANPIRRSFMGATNGSSNNNYTNYNHQDLDRKPLPVPPAQRLVCDGQRSTQDCDQSSLSDYISDLCLNRSQSPPVQPPPPPNELKSMLYMESSLDDYSNYDEFTYSRNQRTSALLMNSLHRVPKSMAARQRNTMMASNGSPVSSIDYDEPDSWQMTSLPVAYEKNLANVLEEQAAPPGYEQQNKQQAGEQGAKLGDALIKPPERFVDQGHRNGRQSSGMSHTSSNQSLTSVTTTDSVLDFHRQTGTAFRFSYGQPNAFENGQQQQHNDASLPPRKPTYEPIKTTTTDYGSSGGCLDNDGDTTLLSDTSTLHGDSCKCAEFERTIGSLKDKLICKEKELTDLQLKQWSSDYLIDQLKSTISRLEKENAQLKKNVMINVNNRVNL